MARLRCQSWFNRLAAALVVIGMLETGVVAQFTSSVPGGWDAAIAAPTGTEVRVHLLDGGVVSGILQETRTDALVVTRQKLERGRLLSSSLKGPSSTFARGEVARVEVGPRENLKGKRRLTNALITTGAVIGGIALAIVAVCASGRGCGS